MKMNMSAMIEGRVTFIDELKYYSNIPNIKIKVENIRHTTRNGQEYTKRFAPVIQFWGDIIPIQIVNNIKPGDLVHIEYIWETKEKTFDDGRTSEFHNATGYSLHKILPIDAQGQNEYKQQQTQQYQQPPQQYQQPPSQMPQPKTTSRPMPQPQTQQQPQADDTPVYDDDVSFS